MMIRYASKYEQRSTISEEWQATRNVGKTKLLLGGIVAEQQ